MVTKSMPQIFDFKWWCCRTSWKSTLVNTAWCLLGCSIGDIGTILYFQITGVDWPVLAIMGLAIVNGLLTSILLETLILMRSLAFASAIKTAAGMSLISMLGMEAAMNLTDFMMTGGAVITWWVLPYILVAGFIAPLPYNYWRLKALGVSCH